MMHSQHEHERQVKVVINRYQNEAIHAEQLRMARGYQPTQIGAMGASIRSSVSAMLSSVRSHLQQHAEAQALPAAAEVASELVDIPESAVRPADHPALA